MSTADTGHWQLQEAKQHFSELIRATESRGTQFVTRHGDEVAAVVPIQEYRRSMGTDSLAEHLLSLPPLDDDTVHVLDAVVEDRKNDLGRRAVFGDDE